MYICIHIYICICKHLRIYRCVYLCVYTHTHYIRPLGSKQLGDGCRMLFVLGPLVWVVVQICTGMVRFFAFRKQNLGHDA